MPFPQHIAHMLLAALEHLSPGCCCRLKNRGIAAHIPLQCPETNIDWRWSGDGRRYLLLHDSGFIKRSPAAFTHRTCIFARWGYGTRECSSGHAGASGAAGLQRVFSDTVLAGIESIPAATFIAPGRERLICMAVSLAAAGLSKNKCHEVIHSLS